MNPAIVTVLIIVLVAILSVGAGYAWGYNDRSRKWR